MAKHAPHNEKKRGGHLGGWREAHTNRKIKSKKDPLDGNVGIRPQHAYRKRAGTKGGNEGKEKPTLVTKETGNHCVKGSSMAKQTEQGSTYKNAPTHKKSNKNTGNLKLTQSKVHESQ